MATTPTVDQQARFAADFLQEKFKHLPAPRFGIVLGTGADLLARQIECQNRINYHSIPHFPSSTALGHKSQWVVGYLGGQPLAAMDGRFHLYEGYHLDAATLPIRVMWLLGIKYLIVTNAAGGLNPLFQRGEIMLINSHLDLMFRGSTNSRYPECLHRPLLRADAYDESLINLATKIARRNDIHLHRGVYASLLGPTYETRAEYRMLRRIGADAVGMSTVPEVTVAAQLKMAILGLSVITNLAKPDALASTSGQEVVRAARTAAPNVLTIVQSLIADLG